MRNYFNIVRSTGLIFLGTGASLLFLTLPEFLERINRIDFSYGRSVWEDGLAFFLFLGLFTIIVGIGGLLKMKWFSKVATANVILAIVFFAWFFFDEILPKIRHREFYIILTGGILTFIVLGSLLVLVGNQNFLKALEEEDEKLESDDNILDA